MKIELTPGICFRCKQPYRKLVANDTVTLNGEPVKEMVPEGEEWGAFYLSMFGSYGSFVDTVIDAMAAHPDNMIPMKPLPTVIDGVCMTCYSKEFVVLCHDCAHALCDFLGIDKETQKQTTSHPRGYLEEHPDHPAWESDIDWSKNPPERKN